MGLPELLTAFKALVSAGQFDQASAMLAQYWDDLILYVLQDIYTGGAATGILPTVLENLSIDESWNLHLRAAEDFGALGTYVYGVPNVDQASIILPITGIFVPSRGYRWHVRNGSTTNRLTLDPDGAATIGGGASYDVEPGGAVELLFDATAGKELSVIAASSTERTVRVPLAGVDGAAGILSWQNPHGAALLVRIVLDVTTPATGSLTADFGIAATAVSNDTLMDGVNVGAASGVFSSISNAGTNGKAWRKLVSGGFVTGSTATGAASGLVGNAFISYRIA